MRGRARKGSVRFRSGLHLGTMLTDKFSRSTTARLRNWRATTEMTDPSNLSFDFSEASAAASSLTAFALAIAGFRDLGGDGHPGSMLLYDYPSAPHFLQVSMGP